MRKVKTTPAGAEPNRFSDLTGYITKAGEPPNWSDASRSLWALYFALKGNRSRRVPDAAGIKKELRRLRQLDAKGRWDRDTRRER